MVMELTAELIVSQRLTEYYVTRLIHYSVWFQVEPRPDDTWHIAIKACDSMIFKKVARDYRRDAQCLSG